MSFQPTPNAGAIAPADETAKTPGNPNELIYFQEQAPTEAPLKKVKWEPAGNMAKAFEHEEQITVQAPWLPRISQTESLFECRLEDLREVHVIGFGHGVQPCGDCERFLHGAIVILLTVGQHVDIDQGNKAAGLSAYGIRR